MRLRHLLWQYGHAVVPLLKRKRRRQDGVGYFPRSNMTDGGIALNSTQPSGRFENRIDHRDQQQPMLMLRATRTKNVLPSLKGADIDIRRRQKPRSAKRTDAESSFRGIVDYDGRPPGSLPASTYPEHASGKGVLGYIARSAIRSDPQR